MDPDPDPGGPKHVDPVDPDLDPQHWTRHYFRKRGKGKHIVIKKVTKTWCIQSAPSTSSSASLPPQRKKKPEEKLKTKARRRKAAAVLYQPDLFL
jgi:hypothetical protein